MATIKNGILGGVSGKVGNVIGGNWKGISYLRAVPKSSNRGNSFGQINARNKMGLVVQFLQTCTPFVRIGFSGFAVKMTAFNAATAYNYNAVMGEYPELTLDYSQVLLTRGNLTGAANSKCTSPEPLKINFSWDDNSGTGTASATDIAMLLVYNPAKNQSVYVLQSNTRSQLSAVLDLPVDFAGDMVHCYLAFVDMSRYFGSQPKNFISASCYAGSLLVTAPSV